MKKYIGIILVVSSFAICSALDLTKYQNVQFVKEVNVTQPSVAEITNLSRLGNYIITNDKGEAVEQQSLTVVRSVVIPPQQAEGCLDTCINAQTLADGNTNTTFDFPLASQGVQHGKIKIVYAKPLETDSIVFETTGDSYVPTAFTLMIDGKRILNTMQGRSAKFPKMMAQSIEISFDYNQPIRFTEVGVGLNKEESVTNSLRFVYQPKVKYILYSDAPTGRDTVSSPAVNLFTKNK